MTDGPTRTQLALWAAAAIAIALLGARYLRSSSPAAPVATAPAAVEVTQRRSAAATVHVAGAVRRPGVYRLRPGERVDDAVRRAGGATGRADLGAVNLAAKVEDGRQILVPERAPATPEASASAEPAGPAAPGTPLNLNTATLEQLDTLPGVGPATAEKILAYREEHDRRRTRPGDQAGHEGRERRVQRIQADGRGPQRRAERRRPPPLGPLLLPRERATHTRTCSRSVARRLSPMPGTWPSSSTAPKAPCSSR